MSARREARAAAMPAPASSEPEGRRHRFPVACYVCKMPVPPDSAAVVCDSCLPARLVELSHTD